MATTVDYDVVIAGGGMVGASLALLLSHHTQDRLKILIIEQRALPKKNALETQALQPSFDTRSTALSYGSRLLLESLGVWPQLAEQLSVINSIHVSNRGCFGSMQMHTDETNWPALGYVVENTWLGNVLLDTLYKKNNISFNCPASVSSVSVHSVSEQCAGVTVDITNKDAQTTPLNTQLVIVVDGADSKLRKQLGITANISRYNQTALIANVSFSKPHNNRAYERFTREGPVALLPLTDSEQGLPRGALVWTMSSDKAQTLLHGEEELFLPQLQHCFGHRQGEFLRVGKRTSYPLTLVESVEQVRSHIAIMGNAAHTLHPVAGQGFNLALRDCARFAMVVATSLHEGVPLGSLSSLNRYVAQQYFDQQKTITFSDYLPTIFGSKLWGMSILRSLGLAAFDVMPRAKKPFIYHAAGLHDGAPLAHMS